MARYKYRIFKLGTVNASAAVLEETFRIEDNNASAVTSISLTTDRVDQITYRGEVEVRLSNDTIYPPGFPARALLMGGGGTAPNERFLTRQGPLEYGNGSLMVRYTDVNSAAVAFAAYTVNVLVEYELTANPVS